MGEKEKKEGREGERERRRKRESEEERKYVIDKGLGLEENITQ